MYGVSGNGQWVRARNEQGAKLIMAEQEMDRRRRLRSEERGRDLRRQLRAGFREIWRRLRGTEDGGSSTGV